MADKALEARDRALEAKDKALEANKVADMALAAASRAVRAVRAATVVDGAAGIVVAVAVALLEAWLVRELSAWTGKACVRPKWSRTSLKMASRFRSS
ncbi:MAG: hypothetical protein WCP23_00025 [Planctomycetota bacterium]